MTQQPNKIHMLVADDHEVVRSGLKTMLAETDITIVGEVSTAAAAVKYTLEHEIDVVLMDIRMSDGDGLTAMGRIRLDKPNQPVVIFSYFDNPVYIARAVAMGANSYLLKNCKREEMINAIQVAAKGESTWTREELRRVTGALATPRFTTDIEVPLTQREGEVLKQMANGMTNKQIADSMHISYETVKEHVQHLLRKIGLTDRTQAAVWAVRKGLV
jgi:DNA-binding NarL/FixJ family response regulator